MENEAIENIESEGGRAIQLCVAGEQGCLDKGKLGSKIIYKYFPRDKGGKHGACPDGLRGKKGGERRGLPSANSLKRGKTTKNKC